MKFTTIDDAVAKLRDMGRQFIMRKIGYSH